MSGAGFFTGFLTILLLSWIGTPILADDLPVGSEQQYVVIQPGIHSGNSSVDLFSSKRNYVHSEIIVKFKKTLASSVEEGVSRGQGICDIKLSDSLDKLNKKYKSKSVTPLFKNFKARRQRQKKLLGKDRGLLSRREKRAFRRLRRVPKNAEVPDLDRIYKIQVELETGQLLEDAVTAYNNDPDVEYAELNYMVSINLTPNDPLYSMQWPLANTGQMYPESGRYNPPPGAADCDIDASKAWNMVTGSSEIIIAVVDTGVDYAHRDIDDNMWVNEAELNGTTDVDDDLNGYVDDIYGYDFINTDGDPNDDHGHGTHCAGIIAAETDNSNDIAGVCWNARVMALKFLDAGGSGQTSDAVAAFYYAVENGADVVSNSWGGGGYLQSMQDAIDYAYSQGVIMVAASGNSWLLNSPQYPASYPHMISVAATDSNDQMAPFSNHGDWVDIAAPGVDILSLRANGTSMGTTYDDYTTIASGTSMACPHVSGACALVLSHRPDMQIDEVEQYLQESADSISSKICATGRLNVYGAMMLMPAPQGQIFFDNDFYSCSGAIEIKLLDSDIEGSGVQEVIVSTNEGDSETVILTETSPAIGVFAGIIPTDSEDANNENGIVQLSHGEIITITYEDSNDGTGNPAIATDTATADCQGPVISTVQIDVPGPEPTVTFETNESTTVRVLCGTECGEPNDIIAVGSTFATTHTIQLHGVFPETDYYFIIEATDAAGNGAVDDNSGTCYTFTTDGPGDVNVPGDYSTIQMAIDRSWDNGTVWVADKAYTGEGNHDIDFRGKSIVVRSENGPNNCIIDCQTLGRGFLFHNNENEHSVLEGFTITNGYADRGGGIFCSSGSPTIRNCIINENSAGGGTYNSGGGFYNNYNSNPILNNCEFNNNSASYGGGIYNNSGNLSLTNCIFNGNSAENGGGMFSIRSNPTLTNCIFFDNLATQYGGGVSNTYGSKLKLVNCMFSENSASSGGAVSSLIASYPILINCTVSKNTASQHGGGLYSDIYSTPVLSNCILWDNSDMQGTSEPSQITGISSVINYSCIQGWTGTLGGTGNFGDDPLFADVANNNYHLQPDSLCIDAGDNTAVPPSLVVDLDDKPRLVDDPCTLDTGNGTLPIVDIGAFEDSGSGFLLSTLPIVVPEGATTTFTVALAKDPCGIIGVAVAYQSGDTDITVQSGASLTFNSSNYTQPQTVILAAAEDTDYFSGVTLIWINASEFPTTAINAAEVDNESVPSVLYVDTNAPGANDGTSWTDAFVGLDEALSVAEAYQGVEEILVAQGTYRPAEPAIRRMATFTLVDSVTIKGGYAGVNAPDPNVRDTETYKTILSGDLDGDDEPDFANNSENSYHVVTSSRTDETAVLDGFAIIAGNANGFDTESYGGGMYNWCGNPTVIDCTFSKNKSTSYGAGMYNYESSTRLTDCTFSENRGRYGGGLYIYNYENRNEQILTNCTFSENRATMWGGGLFNGSGNPILTNCIFSKNSAAYAGGMHNRINTSPKLSNCQFIENFALYGGGATVDDMAYPEMSNCLFIKNSTDGDGGGICCFGGGSRLTNCTFSANSAGNSGGGVYAYSGITSLTNCIFWDNLNSEIDGSVLVAYSNVKGGWSGQGNLDTNPLFIDAANDDYHLQWDSPCINAGDPIGTYTDQTDIDGDQRVFYGRVDMGLDEVYPIAGDFEPDEDVDMADLATFVNYWLNSCSEPDWCNSCDIDKSNLVDFIDFAKFANHWKK
ncbi:MAG: S8 family serine peptidase [Planctomycetota bacterium]